MLFALCTAPNKLTNIISMVGGCWAYFATVNILQVLRTNFHIWAAASKFPLYICKFYVIKNSIKSEYYKAIAAGNWHIARIVE